MYWFMRMKQGSEGKDFASGLWSECLVGVMFGTWTLNDVSDGAGGVDEGKITQEWLSKYLPTNQRYYKRQWSDASRRFLVEMSADEKVVVEFGDALHIATVTDEYRGDPNPSLRDHGEHFKCRRIHSRKDFPLERLPSSYRLISTTGRGTIQRIRAYKPLVELLDRYDTPEEVTEACREMSTEQLLEVLSPKQWETICAEFLRDTEGMRALLLAVGSTLKDIDIYGVNHEGKRILAQCKNDTRARDAKTINDWTENVVADPEDLLYFFARGGVKDQLSDDRCKIVDGKDILWWLDSPSQKHYVKHLKTL